MARRLVILCLLAAAAMSAAAEHDHSSAIHVAGAMMQKPHHARPRTAKPRRARQAAKQTPAAATPNDPMWPSSWGMRALDMPAAWRLGQGAPKVVVAVLDTGVDSSQPDLAGALVPGWNAITNTADTSDTYGHGTEVAGVIAARANNHLGGSGYCARCAVMPVKVLDGAGGGSSTTVAAGIRWAAAHGATVLNLSLVLAGRDPAVSSAIADATAQGLLVVASAGNDGGTSANYPAADPGAISVAAADPSDALYPWSNHGSWITVSAPGCNEATTVGNGYAEFCGTSSATAAVSGVLALAVADCGCSAATVSRALTATAKSGSPPRVDGGALVASLSADSTRRPT